MRTNLWGRKKADSTQASWWRWRCVNITATLGSREADRPGESCGLALCVKPSVHHSVHCAAIGVLACLSWVAYQVIVYLDFCSSLLYKRIMVINHAHCGHLCFKDDKHGEWHAMKYIFHSCSTFYQTSPNINLSKKIIERGRIF